MTSSKLICVFVCHVLVTPLVWGQNQPREVGLSKEATGIPAQNLLELGLSKEVPGIPGQNQPEVGLSKEARSFLGQNQLELGLSKQARSVPAQNQLGLSKQAPGVPAQNQPEVGLSKQARSIPGYLDPKTGMFTTKSPAVVAGPTVPIVTTNILARLVFNFNIQNDQTGGGPTQCSVSLQSQGDANGYYDEYAQSTATAGGTICSVTLLFSWDLATPATDTISVYYNVSSSNEDINGRGSYRSTYHYLSSMSVPSNFETINLPPINVTI